MSLGDRYDRVKKAHKKNNRSKSFARVRLRDWGIRLLRWAKWSAIGGLAVGVAGAGWFGWYYKNQVLDEPGEHISKENIQAIVAQESPVLYRDGRTRIGVFFAKEHREYVSQDRIPKAWKDAIVAAEDQRFWTHPGFDIQGIARAMKQNIEAGRLVAGGSSLTQQTAKNLYYRPDRSLKSKWRELINALRLEAHYSKEDILEFYANQFHVSANGRGIGIAARYFFDKEVEELTTLECAFLAGMVKAPASYNPFTGGTDERRTAARLRARHRTRYVLDRMRSKDALTAAEHARLIEQDIPFKKGEFRYASSVLVDEVAARLEQAPFPELFADLGIDNPSTAGVQVVTTLDPDAQREATWALWHHLTEVGGVLEGATAASLRLPAASAPTSDPDNPPGRHDFSAATVTGVDESGQLVLDLGGASCTVGPEAMKRVASVLVQAKKGEPWKKARKADVAALTAALPAGSVVWASLDEAKSCSLEIRPALQGALMVLEDGAIRAMVGGNDNRNFNRAIDARRQLGSTWKPLVYHAAMQLGWTPTDLLDNREGVFHFEGTWYYPRADHTPDDAVSMGWAGTRSENLASIWLLAHLVDRLDSGEFRDVAGQVGLAPRKREGRTEWIRRIRDDWGIISTPSRFPELAFVAAREEIIGSGALSEREALELRSLHYGRGIATESARVERKDRGATLARKRRALTASSLRLGELAERCSPQAEALTQLLVQFAEAAEEPGIFGRLFDRAAPDVALPDPTTFADLRVRVRGQTLDMACGEQPGDGWSMLDTPLLEVLKGSPLVAPAEAVDPVLEGRLRVSTLVAVQRAAQRRRLVLEGADAYDLEVLQLHPDFRQLVSMRYLAAHARRLGVSGELPPVLSLPLGAVDLSLEEAASMYQGMLSGNGWQYPGVRPGALPGLGSPVPDTAGSTLLIAEIRDRNGDVIYQAKPEASPVADPVASRLVGDVLRNVVEWGTGRRARGAVTLGGRPVPVAGKTGTTNGFRNAAFIGFVPSVIDGKWTGGHGFTIAAYVGYDDNRPMRHGGLRLAGASGALPAWIGAAQGLADAGLLGEAPPEDGSWVVGDGYARVPVIAQGGLPAAPGVDTEGRTILVYGDGLEDDGTVKAERRIVPVPRGGLAVPLDDATGPLAPPTTEELEAVWLDEWDGAPTDAVPGDAPSASDLPPEWAPDGDAGEIDGEALPAHSNPGADGPPIDGAPVDGAPVDGAPVNEAPADDASQDEVVPWIAPD